MSKSIIQPDSPFRIGASGKFKLLIKSVTEKFGDYEYLLIDADEKEYKSITKALYSEGQLLRCIVSFKVEKAKLVVESVTVCSKQDLATPIPVASKATPPPTTQEHEIEKQSTVKPKQKKSKSKSNPKITSGIQPVVKSKSTKLGCPERSMISGEYNLRVYDRVRGKVFTGANFRYLLEDADEFSYFALSNQFFEIGSILACDVKVKESADSKEKKLLREVSILYKAKSGPKRKNKDRERHGSGKGGKRNSGYTQYDWASTPYTGGCHIIYTRM